MKPSQNFLLASFLTILGSSSFAATTVATVNGKALTDEDLKTLVSGLPQYQRDQALKDPNTRKQLIQDLVDQELMTQEATREGLDKTKEYNDQLTILRKQTLVNTLVQKKLAPRVTDKSVRDYFDRHKTRYSTDQVRAQHILVSSEAEARSVLAEVKKPGVDFQKVAETRSKDPSAKNTRGDVGYFSRTMFDQAFTDAAFSASVGEIVGPVKTAFGFHVIKVTDRKVGKVPDFAEVEQAVRTDYQREVLKSYVLDLRKKYKVKE